jgi:two-component system, NarL family, sensor kinase
MRQTACITVMLMLSAFARSQFEKRDSLLRLLPAATQDTNKVKLLLSIGDEVENNEPVTAARYAMAAEELSRKLSYNEGIYASLTSIAQSYYIRGFYDTCVTIFNQVLQLSYEMKDELKTGIANINLGTAYREKGDFEKALEYFLKGRQVIEKTNNEALNAKTNDAVQALYVSRAEYDKAIIFGEMALLFARKSTDRVMLAQYLINLAVSYQAKKRSREAEAMLNESLAIAKAVKDKRIEAVALMNLADLAIKNKDSYKIRSYCSQSLKLSREIGSFDNEALALRALAISFLMEAKLDSADVYARQAYMIDTAKQFRKETLEVLDLLSHIHFAAGKISEAFDDTRKFGDGFQLFVGDMIKQQSADLEKKYETEKKQAQIMQLQSEALLHQFSLRQKSTLNYILAGSAGALLIISLLSYRTFRHRQGVQQQKIHALETEKQLTATEAVLKGEEQERARLAKDLHDGLGGMLSGIKYSFNTMKGNLVMTPDNAQAFERSMDMLDSSIKEMRRVAHNMMPEALVEFGLETALNDFCRDINKSGAINLSCQTLGLKEAVIDEAVSVAIYRIVQELINNTMKHAAATNAIIQISKNENLLSITVEDDGKGFDPKLLQTSAGMGWSNIKSRVDYLKGKLDFRSEPGKGTSVLIELNV